MNKQPKTHARAIAEDFAESERSTAAKNAAPLASEEQTLTPSEVNALWGAFKTGSAVHTGKFEDCPPSTWHMLKRMAKKGLLNENSLFSITPKGMQALRDAVKRPRLPGWARKWPEDLAEVEAALAVLHIGDLGPKGQ